MANPIALLKSFVDGQGAGAAGYITYDADFDYNFTQLEGGFNTLNTEFQAFGGQNAALVLDLSTTLTLVTGFIGAGSFTTSFPNSVTLRIFRGEALTSTGRVSVAGQTDLVGSGTAGLRYAALSSVGTISLATSAASAALDLYSVNWNGTSFDQATLTRLPGTGASNIIVDGDDFQAQRAQENLSQGTGGSTLAGLGVYTYDRIADRISDIVRVLLGRQTSSVGTAQALRGIAFGGTVSLPGLLLTDGVSTFENTTGLFRPAANQLGITVQGTEAVRYSRAVAGQPQAEMRAGTALATPPATYSGDLDSGFGWISSDYHRVLAGGVSVMEWRTTGGLPKALVPLGVVGNPSLSFVADENTGTYSPGADQYAIATAGVQAQAWNPQGQRTSPTQFRCSVNQSASQSLANNTYTAVLFNAEDYDVGGMHDAVTNTDRITIPTGGGGVYSVGGYVTFAESTAGGGGTANAGQRGVQITRNGAVVAEALVNAATTGDTKLPLPAVDVLTVATDILRATAYQTCGGTMNITASRATARLED